MRRLMCLLFLLPGLAFAAASPPHVTARDQVRLISETNNSQAGTIKLALEFTLQPGWHIYWSNPGDAGVAPTITAPAPAQFGAFSFPPPEFLQTGPVTSYVLSGHVILPFAASGVGQSLTASANWLVCNDVCVPEHADFTLALNGGASTEAGLFTPSTVIASPFPVHIAPDGTLSLSGLGAAQIARARFFPDQQGEIVNNAPQILSFASDGLMLHVARTKDARGPLSGVLELTDRSGQMQALQVTAQPGAALTHPPYLLLAFLGGLILNLMPCVFPILAMKALALAKLGGAARLHIRQEAFGYCAGVMLAMLILGIILLGGRALGSEIGWGFQFQSPVFVALTAWLMLAAALNLAGFFEISLPSVLGRIPAQDAILTGMLAVLLATPCTAPFMGVALAAALAAPSFLALGIFLALGAGLAAPFLLLAAFPRLAGFIPRPGPWMIWLRRILCLPMLGAFLWLTWVLDLQAGMVGLALLLGGALIIVLALIIPHRRIAAVVAFALLPFLHAGNSAATITLPGAQPYTAARLSALRALGQPVFVDLTAAWCVTCLVNEATTLENPAVQADFKAKKITLLVGDWTNKNPEISSLLAENARDGVPLYLYYPPGHDAAQLLPQVLTPQIVENALQAPGPTVQTLPRGG